MFRVSSAVLPLASCRKCTGFVAVIAATALALLCPRPAAAQYGSGSWSFDNLYHVEENSSPAGSSASSTQDAPLNYVRYSAALGSNALRVGADGSASATAKVKGRVRIVATWTPPYSYGGTSTPAPTPPPTVTVRFTATALANGPSGSTSFTLHSDGTQGTHTIALSSPQVDNGFGDPMVLTYDSPLYNGNLGGKEWQSSGIHLKTFSTASMTKDSSGNWKGEFPLDASMSASLTANASGYVTSVGSDITDSTGNVLYVNTNLLGFGDVTGDSRSYILSSPSFFDGNGKNWRKDGDPTIGLYPTENKPQVVDTIATLSQSPSGNDQYSGGGSFSVDPRNFIIPRYSLDHHWSWIGDGSPDSAASSELAATRSYIHLPVSGSTSSTGLVWFGADPKSFPKHSTVKVTATDSDGVKAEDSIAITWHLPLENVQPDYAYADVSDIRYQTASSWVVLNMPVTVTYNAPSVWWSIAGTGTTVLAGGAAFLPPPVDAIVGLALIGANIGITSAAPNPVVTQPTFSYD